MERYIESLKYGFRFEKFELGMVPDEAFGLDYDDSNWQSIRVPHDWAIGSEFSADNDPVYQDIVTEGIMKPILQTARTGGLPIVGAGVYRRWIDISKSDEGKRIFLELDGVMWRSEVYVNGIKVGGCHYGYKSYEVEITDAISYGTANLIAVLAEVDPGAGRWYSGSGIYRNMRLVKKATSYIRYDGIWVRQLYADNKQGIFELSVDIEGASGFTADIFDSNGNLVKNCSTDKESLIFEIEEPELWDIDSPQLYTVRVLLESGDFEKVRFGVRVSEFTKEGYFLNGRKLKLNGVCMHHDLGSLGAIVNVAAMRRQLEIMQEMGANALRTTHNPPAPELLDLCDEMGILVIDEFFDEWTITKVVNGYAKYFEKYAIKDAEDIIRRDRNHPCVIMWSIGNELKEQEIAEGWRPAKLLSNVVHTTDPTRPVNGGFQEYPGAFINHLVNYVDVVGLNYKAHRYQEIHEKYPNLILLGSETESCLSTRSVYHFPAKVDIPATKYDDLTVSAYDLSAWGIAYYPERELAAQQDCPFVAGEFIWTGFDYLGEPTPYFTEWPSRSAYFGVVDMAGIPKNRYYCYRSVWTDIPTLHIFPHWTWPGREGQNVPVHIFTNYYQVELFVNGKSQGRKCHEKDNDIERFRLMWNEVIYEPGEITAVAYDKNGNEVERKTVRTAGEPYAIQLEAYKDGLVADGDDVNYITASIVDREGNLCENSNLRLTFTVSGAAELLTTDAGDQRETESFIRPDKKALGGKLVACIRSLKDVVGVAAITCEGMQLKTGRLVLESK